MNSWQVTDVHCQHADFLLIGTFDLQKVELKSIDDNKSVCLKCFFTSGSIASGCVVKLRINTDEIFELSTSAKKHDSVIEECYHNDVLSSQSYYWEAYAAIGTEMLSLKPAFTGNLTIQTHKSESVRT